MKISIFSKHLHWLGLKEMAETAAAIGFDGVDLTVRAGGHVDPETVEDTLPKAFEACKNAGVEITMLCTDIQDASLPTTEKVLKAASSLGIKHYRLGWFFYDDKKSLAANLSDIKNKLENIEAISREYGIKACYQNHEGNWFGSPVWDLGIILQQINSEWLGSQYDILNATLEGIYSWQLGLELLAPYIHTIDIKDGYWNFENGKPKLHYTPLGNGMVDFKEFFRLTKKFNINAPLSVHYEYPLGGCETGSSKLSVPEKEVITAIKNDLQKLRE
ncbi:MAG: sugar phosphate isomerase/epimerase [Melioribacteraceae bacterium]|nr:sugar phosphate isomerase/epimerase [Melioribacteraceae bacterium]